MSEENSTSTESAAVESVQEGVEPPAEPAHGFEPITSQAQLNKVLNALSMDALKEALKQALREGVGV